MERRDCLETQFGQNWWVIKCEKQKEEGDRSDWEMFILMSDNKEPFTLDERYYHILILGEGLKKEKSTHLKTSSSLF